MEPYLLILVTLLFLSIIRGSKTRHKLTLILFILMMFLCGYRGENVGVDTLNYWQGYKYGSERLEPLFQIIMQFCRLLDFSPKGFTLTVAFITYLPLCIFIRKNSSDFTFSVLIYFCFSVYFFHETFNTIRLCSAVMYALWCYYYIDKKKYLISFSFAIIAFLLHYSAIIIIPFVVLSCFIRKIGLYTLLFTIGITIIFGLLFEVGFGDTANGVVAMGFFQYFDSSEWFQHYFDDLNETSYSLFGSLTAMVPFSLFALLMYDRKNVESLYYKLFFISVVLQNIFVSLIFTYRVTIYFTTLLVVILPNTFARAKTVRKICLFALCSFMVMWYIYLLVIKTDPNRLAGTIPYHF